MIDFGRWMRRSYEHYLVDPRTWCDSERLWCILRGARLTYEMSDQSDLGGSASYESTRLLGECYVRTYVVCEQNGESGRWPLGTWLVQTCGVANNGRRDEVSVDAYPPTKELADDGPESTFFLPAGADAVAGAASVVASHCRAPSCIAGGSLALAATYASKPGESWHEIATGLMGMCGSVLMPDPSGHIVALPKREPEAMAPVAAFDDGSASVVRPGKEVTYDYYGIPNKVVVTAKADGRTAVGVAVNDNPASPMSVQSRGRVSSLREEATDLVLAGGSLQAAADKRARELLREKSLADRSVTYERAWRPDVRVGDCVRIDFERPDAHARAIVVKQEISCTPAGTVKETVKWKEAML